MKSLIDDHEGEQCNCLRLDYNLLLLIHSFLNICRLDGLAESCQETSSQHVANQALWAIQESNTALNRHLQTTRDSNATLNEDFQVARASVAAANQELASKATTLDELAVREQATQDKLQALGDEKRLQEQVLESTQKMFDRDYSSSIVISSVLAHAVALLKSYTPDLDPELFCKENPFEDDDEWHMLIDSDFETAQHFVLQYNFSVVDDQDSLGTQS
jgi:septal ring factor EnvC (AmiA/AmiB activator)